MFSQLSVVAHKIGDRCYHFLCDPISPISEAKEALSIFMKGLEEIEEKAKSQTESVPKEEEKNE